MKIYNLGSLNIDYVYAVEHFVTAGETLSSENMTVFPGGKGLNQSVALSRAGAKVIHGAVVGDGGEMLINAQWLRPNGRSQLLCIINMIRKNGNDFSAWVCYDLCAVKNGKGKEG